MTFRGRIFLALSLVGLVPLALLGWQSFVLNRAELETTVVGAQAALARSAAQGAEKWVAQTVEQLRLAVGYLPYDRLSQSELAAVLRIPFRQLRSVMVLVLLDEQGRAVAPPLAAGPELAPERGTIGEAGLDELSKRIPGRIKVDDQPDGRRVLRIESEGAGGVAETTSARFSVLSTGAGRARGQVLHRQRRRRCAALGEGALDLSAGEPGAGSTSTVLLPAKAPGLSSAPGLPVAGS